MSTSPISSSMSAPVYFKQQNAVQNTSAVSPQAEPPKNVKKDDSSKLLLSLAAIGSAALAGVYIYKHKNVNSQLIKKTEALNDAETKIKDLESKLSEAENKINGLKNKGKNSVSSSSISSSSTEQHISSRSYSDSPIRSRGKSSSGKRNRSDQDSKQIHQEIQTSVQDTAQQVKPKNNESEIINNVETVNLNAQERKLVEQAVADTPTPADVTRFQEQVAYVKPTVEEQEVINRINSEAQQAVSEARRIENNLDEKSLSALERLKASLENPEAVPAKPKGKPKNKTPKQTVKTPEQVAEKPVSQTTEVSVKEPVQVQGQKPAEVVKPAEVPEEKIVQSSAQKPVPPKKKMTEQEMQAADERMNSALNSPEIDDELGKTLESLLVQRKNSDEAAEILYGQWKDIVFSKLGDSYPERICRFVWDSKKGMSEDEVVAALKRFDLLDDFQRVNETVNVNGENIRILFKGVDFDITSEGRLLKKVKNGYDNNMPDMRETFISEFKASYEKACQELQSGSTVRNTTSEPVRKTARTPRNRAENRQELFA